MQIEILEYIDDVRGAKLASIDIKVIHSDDKYEIFRNLSHFRNERGEWLAMPNVKRHDQWIPLYERQPNNFKEVLLEAKKAVSARAKAPQDTARPEDYGAPPADTFEF